MMMSLSAARRRISVNEAAVKLLALRADAAVGARIQLGPQMAVLRQFGQLRAVAAFGGLLPVADDAELADLFQSVQQRLSGEVVELLAAEIIAAALHVADAQFAEMLAQKRNVFEEELLLQGLGAGRNDDAFAGTDYRQQVGQRLASTGAGFDDQVAALLQRLLHRLRHLKLPAAEFVRRMSTCQHATRAEELKERRQTRGQCGGLWFGRHGARSLVPIIVAKGQRCLNRRRKESQ